MNLNAVVEIMTRKARDASFITGMALLLAVHLHSETLAQDGTDRVTGFARAPVQVAAWPGGKKVAGPGDLVYLRGAGDAEAGTVTPGQLRR